MSLKLVDDNFVPPVPDVTVPSLKGAATHVRMAVEHLGMAYAHTSLDGAQDNPELRQAMADAGAKLGLVMARLAEALRAELQQKS